MRWRNVSNQVKLSPERWAYLKALRPSPGRYIVAHTHPNRKACGNKAVYAYFVPKEVDGKLTYETAIARRDNKPYRRLIND
jgi:hypothetical protein